MNAEEKIVQHAREAKPVNPPVPEPTWHNAPSWHISGVGIVLAVAAIVIVFAVLSGLHPAKGADFTVSELEAALGDKPDGAKVELLPENGFTGQPIKSVINVGGVVQIVGGRADEPERFDSGGLYVLLPGQQGDNNTAFPFGSRLSDALSKVKLPHVTGATIRFRLDHVWDDKKQEWKQAGWGAIDNVVNFCLQHNKRFTILPMSGEPISDASIALRARVDEQVFLRWGEHIGKSFTQYHVTGVTTGRSEELHYQQGGMSDKLETYMLARMQNARRMFGRTLTLAVAIGGGDDAAMKRFSKWAVELGGPWVFKTNNLKAFQKGNNTMQTWPDAPHNRLLVECCKPVSVQIGFEAHSAAAWRENNMGSKDPNDALRQAVKLCNRVPDPVERMYVAMYHEDIPRCDSRILQPATVNAAESESDEDVQSGFLRYLPVSVMNYDEREAQVVLPGGERATVERKYLEFEVVR